MDALREQLADVQHEIWSHWMHYMFTQGTYADGAWTMPADKVERWFACQMATPYSGLTWKEQESDRHQADKVLIVLQPGLGCRATCDADYFYTEALRLRLDGDMLGTPMSLAEWLAEGGGTRTGPRRPFPVWRDGIGAAASMDEVIKVVAKARTHADVIPAYAHLLPCYGQPSTFSRKPVNDVILAKWGSSGLCLIVERAWIVRDMWPDSQAAMKDSR